MTLNHGSVRMKVSKNFKAAITKKVEELESNGLKISNIKATELLTPSILDINIKETKRLPKKKEWVVKYEL